MEERPLYVGGRAIEMRMSIIWVISSVGRAPRWQRGGRRFEPDIDPRIYGSLAQLVERLLRTQKVIGSIPICIHYGHLAQLDFRAPCYERGGREFDPLSDY